jgi:hypothetical protein
LTTLQFIAAVPATMRRQREVEPDWNPQRPAV